MVTKSKRSASLRREAQVGGAIRTDGGDDKVGEADGWLAEQREDADVLPRLVMMRLVICDHPGKVLVCGKRWHSGRIWSRSPVTASVVR